MVSDGVPPEQAWKNLRFTAQELLTPAVSAADGDGFANLVEYTFRSDPRQANPALPPAAPRGKTD